MSRNIIPMYHRHQPWDLIIFCCLKVTIFLSLGTVTGRTYCEYYDMHTIPIFFYFLPGLWVRPNTVLRPEDLTYVCQHKIPFVCLCQFSSFGRKVTPGYIPRTRCHVPLTCLVPEDDSSLTGFHAHPDSNYPHILSRKTVGTCKTEMYYVTYRVQCNYLISNNIYYVWIWHLWT
jgi:hypothetical protein